MDVRPQQKSVETHRRKMMPSVDGAVVTLEPLRAPRPDIAISGITPPWYRWRSTRCCPRSPWRCVGSGVQLLHDEDIATPAQIPQIRQISAHDDVDISEKTDT